MCIWNNEGRKLERQSVVAYKVLAEDVDGRLYSPDRNNSWPNGVLVAHKEPIVSRSVSSGIAIINDTSGIYAFKKKRGAKRYRRLMMSETKLRIVRVRLSGTIIYHDSKNEYGISRNAGYRAQKAEVLKWRQRQ